MEAHVTELQRVEDHRAQANQIHVFLSRNVTKECKLNVFNLLFPVAKLKQQFAVPLVLTMLGFPW